MHPVLWFRAGLLLCGWVLLGLWFTATPAAPSRLAVRGTVARRRRRLWRRWRPGCSRRRRRLASKARVALRLSTGASSSFACRASTSASARRARRPRSCAPRSPPRAVARHRWPCDQLPHLPRSPAAALAIAAPHASVRHPRGARPAPRRLDRVVSRSPTRERGVEGRYRARAPARPPATRPGPRQLPHTLH